MKLKLGKHYVTESGKVVQLLEEYVNGIFLVGLNSGGTGYISILEIVKEASKEETGEVLREYFAEVTEKASDKQTGGSHYKNMKIQPMEYCLQNNMNFGQSNAIKYVSRYKNKNGIEDLKKAIHCIELLIEHEENNEA